MNLDQRLAMNLVVLTGKLDADPLLKYVEDGNSICTVRLAVDHKYKDRTETDLIECLATGKLAECIGETLEKGKYIEVYGKLRVRKMQDRQGESRVYTYIQVERFDYVDFVKFADESMS